MPDPTRRRTVRPIRPVVPGRPVDVPFGGRDPDVEYLYSLVEGLEATAAQIGTIDVPAAGYSTNDVLVFVGGQWTAVAKTALLALGDLSDVIIGSLAQHQVIQYDGSNFVNALLTLTQLGDVTLTSPATGAFLVKTVTDWIDQNFTPGKLGIGTAADPTHRFELADGDQSAWYSGTAFSLESDTAGFNLSKVKTSAHAHGVTLRSDGAPCWDLRMAEDTNNALRSGFGNSDLEIVDYSGDTGLSEIIARISPEEASADALTAKIALGKNAATPRSNPDFFTLDGGDDATALGGARVSHWDSGTTRHALTLWNRHATSRRATINFRDRFHLGGDRGATGATDFRLYDVAANADRLWVDSSGRVRIGNAAPTAFLHLPAGAAGASNAPLKMVAGTNLTTPEAGAWEFDGTDFFATPAATRLKMVLAPVTPSAYTPTNVTTDRAYDANATTLDEIADVLGTLIADLQVAKVIG